MPVKTSAGRATNSALDMVRTAARKIGQYLLDANPDILQSDLYISTCRILFYLVSHQLLADSPQQEQAALLFSQKHGAGLSHLPAAQNDLPADWLAHVYEHLLSFTIVNGQMQEHQGKSKKRSGSFYTPYELAVFAVEQALQCVQDRKDAGGANDKPYENSHRSVLRRLSQLKLVDPAMGGGTFLCAALSQLTEILRCALVAEVDSGQSLYEFWNLVATTAPKTDAQWDSELQKLLAVDGASTNCLSENPISFATDALRAMVAKRNLYGVDIDPGCVQIARLTIAGMCGRFAQDVFLSLENSLKCGDALLGLFRSPQECGQRGWAPHSPSFHWQSDFAPIFERAEAGFDVVVGNPPWEIHKPNSREFFQEHIANYWQLGKQDALHAQAKLAAQDQVVLEQWTKHEKDYKRLSQFFTSGAVYKLQSGADLNAYKLFVELAHQVAGQSGVVSLLIPAGICTDKGAGVLRKTLLQECWWKSVHGFQNTKGIFNIHRSFKFCLLTFQHGASTNEVQINMGHDSVLSARSTASISCPRAAIEAFSPINFSLLDVASKRDLQLLEKICSHAITVDSFLQEREFRFAREFDMTLDSHEFLPREKMELLGYRPDIYGYWICGDWQPIKEKKDGPGIEILSRDGQFVLPVDDIGSVAYPLYEGRMIDQFDDCAKGWVTGKGRRATWKKQDHLEPQYLVPAHLVRNKQSLKVGYLAVGSPTNARSMIAACIGAFPCGNSVPVLINHSIKQSLLLVALLNSFVFDYVLRSKMSGNNINLFLLKECFLPNQLSHLEEEILADVGAALSLNHTRHASSLLALQCRKSANPSFSAVFSQREGEKCLKSALRAALDAYVATMYGLDGQDFAHILADCSMPPSKGSPGAESRSNEKGFWRFEKNVPIHDRIAVRALDAFNRMQSERPRSILQNALNELQSVQQPIIEDLRRHSECLSAIRAH